MQSNVILKIFKNVLEIGLHHKEIRSDLLISLNFPFKG